MLAATANCNATYLLIYNNEEKSRVSVSVGVRVLYVFWMWAYAQHTFRKFLKTYSITWAVNMAKNTLSHGINALVDIYIYRRGAHTTSTLIVCFFLLFLWQICTFPYKYNGELNWDTKNHCCASSLVSEMVIPIQFRLHNSTEYRCIRSEIEHRARAH